MKRRLSKACTSLSLILLVAFGTRMIFAWDQQRKIPAAALSVAPFAQETGNIGYSLAVGKGFSNPFRRETGPTAWLTPIYPLLVAAAFKLFGLFTVSSFFFLVFLNTLFSAAACVPIFHVGKRVAGLGAGAAAAWLWAVFPSAVMFPFEWIWDTSLSALLAATLVWATLHAADSQRLRDWCGYGALWGLALMTNPSLGSLLPFLLGWAAYRARKRQAAFPPVRTRGWLKNAVLALAVAILCCVPWTVRNYAVFHKLVPLRSNFPLELYIGNNENYDDKHPHYPGSITKERETLRYFRMGEMPFMAEEKRKAMNFIHSHPRVELILFGDRFAAFWTGLPNAIQNFLDTDSWLVRVLMLCATLSGVAALAGILVLVLCRSEFAFPLAAYPIVFPLVYYITHTSLRYRHPIEPVVLLLTAIAGQALWRAAVGCLSRQSTAPSP
ncbi:MAG TPA: glycosyltransferase family 39 protein [Candidatus Acidoferrum sp.]|nr:glycosyltransferase family 39 protein [Candidatus Acidoferrum sp.]